MPSLSCDPDEALEELKAAGASVSAGNTAHERWRAELGEANAIAYDDTVVVQGARPADIESVLRGGSGRVHLYFDGGSRGNPGPAAIGWVLVSSDGIVAEGNERIGETTNNRAEYEALARGLEVAREYGFDAVEVRGDSQLVVKQVRGEWDANDPGMRERRVRVHELLSAFPEWSIAHVPREINERADELVNEAFEDG
ncbi:ribonuclease HI [Halalkalicoccus jeotgali]|uniref:Ribonuclease H n=1 Tax=Halalkalicoccus jeotgali (strain DSM 18796 / CECT 7217 / JCM 14584 / KCTC 4019 / B3) TaxID=795797 RepID=D8J8G0_HALJB|nr:ribonuclease HI [Halalkalicoccus jeotgali]ADJ16206.1 ribonuclease H [Halalkalicoccus jeotgali B3]ELY37634.1 ribonuclease H [Halalkalicoccus jeotgali B3]